ncbi:MAG TPA: hypothetical protein VM555_10780 [Tahibacter sp.]|nr:hypothetical protein [Tahibacter sp.]
MRRVVLGKFVTSAVAQITVVDEDGQCLVVEKYSIDHRGADFGRVRRVSMHRLSTGELVNVVSRTEFIVASTGMRLTVAGPDSM